MYQINEFVDLSAKIDDKIAQVEQRHRRLLLQKKGKSHTKCS